MSFLFCIVFTIILRRNSTTYSVYLRVSMTLHLHNFRPLLINRLRNKGKENENMSTVVQLRKLLNDIKISGSREYGDK